MPTVAVYEYTVHLPATPEMSVPGVAHMWPARVPHTSGSGDIVPAELLGPGDSHTSGKEKLKSNVVTRLAI